MTTLIDIPADLTPFDPPEKLRRARRRMVEAFPDSPERDAALLQLDRMIEVSERFKNKS